MIKVGKARLGGSNKKYFKLEKGDNIYRILPPLGNLADDGVWAVYYKIHYGYRGLPDSTGKTRMRPFVSPEVVNRQNKMVEVVDAAKERIETLKSALVAAKERGDVATVKQLSEMVRNYNLDAKWYVNAINKQGEIGLLKIPHKAKQALENQIKILEQEGVDALGIEGRYFNFNRSGDGRDTQYQVTQYKEKIKVDGLGEVERAVPHVLTEELLRRLEKESHDLNKLFKRPTAEEVSRMVKEGATAVEAILGQSQGDEVEEEEDDVDSAIETATSNTAASTGSSNSTTTQATASATPTQQAPAPTASGFKVGTASVGSSSQAPTTQTSAAPQTNQSPEDFLKSVGLG